MNIPIHSKSRRGFTLPEILTAMALFVMLVTVTVSSQVFGLRMHRISEAKLNCTQSARTALNRVRDEARSARLLFVGDCDGSVFNFGSSNSPCAGPALKICATADTNTFVCYYLATNNSLLRWASASPDNVEVISRHITNRMMFQAEDSQGNVLTNDSNYPKVGTRIIRMNLDYYQVEFPTAGGGSAKMHETYRLQTRFVRRTL